MERNPVNQVEATDRIAARYGRTPQAAKRSKALGYLGGASVAVVLVAWLWWAGVSQPGAQFEARDLGYSIVDERNIVVFFEITVTPDTPMKCAIQSLNAEYGIVGWQVVTIPPSQQRTRVFEQALRTSEMPVTGLLYRCWVP
jgi:hypothetical protein